MKNARDLQARIDELHTRKVFLNANSDELAVLRKKLDAGDTSVVPRINELFDLIDNAREWIKTNEKIIKELLK